ncbi:hypothetical protein OH76DRAFT_1483300 [Lentinus brumalis]|uniref:Uncharacterized protein n=1 Tax=Lentinus brumalis TaxID=2498619 RepID=A0A371DA09_9APHY|nr:hypothetical protein OH76DRAFT_1483300 [Polyporus brumalis]
MPAISTLTKHTSRSPAPIIHTSLSESSFKLDSSGIAGFFGGDSAWKAVATTCILKRYVDTPVLLGYYNSPGAYEVVKRCAPLAKSTFWDSLFSGDDRDPAEILGLGLEAKPTFLSASGETIRTGHPAYLIARDAQRRWAALPSSGHTDAYVTIVEPPSQPSVTLTDASIFRRAALIIIWVVVGYGASLAMCIVCALARDWWCFASILTGIFAGGYIRRPLIVTRARLEVTSPECGPNSPKETERNEEGLLLHERGVILLRQCKLAKLRGGLFALVIQFLVQLVLIPQGTLFGQLMFVASLGLSATYNVYLAMHQDDLQTDYLLDLCGLDESSFKQTTMKSKAGMAVFACLALRHQPLYSPRKLLDELVTANGAVWSRWKELVAYKLEKAEPMEFSQEGEGVQGLDEAEKASLAELLKDAEDAYRTQGWQRVDQESSDRSVSDKGDEKDSASGVRDNGKNAVVNEVRP